MKAYFKKIIVNILGRQVLRLKAKNNFKIIGVVGSIGKTSTKIAISRVLASHVRVRYQIGNYNDIVSVPLIFFGQRMPSVWNIFAWISIFIGNERQIYAEYPFDVVVVELGTNHGGDIIKFRSYLHLDIAVITAITPEHMEFFRSIEDVAIEEGSVAFYSDLVFINKDLCNLLPENIDHKKILYYGKDFGSAYKIDDVTKVKDTLSFNLHYKGKVLLNLTSSGVSEVTLYSLTAAAIIALKLEIPPEKIKDTVLQFEGLPGRMQRLKGIKNSTIIDDTYNASPASMIIALDTLYGRPSLQRIAILGMMNELGNFSELEHRKVGQYCDPKFLDLLVTVGKDARFIADEARKRGCNVYEAENALNAGEYVKDRLKENAVVLAKGSQNGVYLEEALKSLLADFSDHFNLVRQEKSWMQKKSL